MSNIPPNATESTKHESLAHHPAQWQSLQSMCLIEVQRLNCLWYKNAISVPFILSRQLTAYDSFIWCTSCLCFRRFENEVISMTASMLHGDEDVVGSLTSGGTESILMAMKAYRDRARKLFPHITQPQMVSTHSPCPLA